jgi:hypothetical protein
MLMIATRYIAEEVREMNDQVHRDRLLLKDTPVTREILWAGLR